MKLSQLQEARYSGMHPIVDWAISQTDYQRKEIRPDEVKRIVADFTTKLGEPERGTAPDGTVSWYWVNDVDERSGEVLDAIIIRQFDTNEVQLIVNR